MRQLVLAVIALGAVAGAPGYHDDEGRAGRKLFLRAPLQLSPVTSRCSAWVARRRQPLAVAGPRLPGEVAALAQVAPVSLGS